MDAAWTPHPCPCLLAFSGVVFFGQPVGFPNSLRLLDRYPQGFRCLAQQPIAAVVFLRADQLLSSRDYPVGDCLC